MICQKARSTSFLISMAWICLKRFRIGIISFGQTILTLGAWRVAMHSLAVENKTEADQRLRAWGSWAASNGDYIGYPNMTPYRRLQGQSIGAAGLTDEEGAHMDAIISDLKAFNKEAREFAVYHYIHGFDVLDMRLTGLNAGRTKAIKLKNEVLTWVCSRLFFNAG